MKSMENGSRQDGLRAVLQHLQREVLNLDNLQQRLSLLLANPPEEVASSNDEVDADAAVSLVDNSDLVASSASSSKVDCDRTSFVEASAIAMSSSSSKVPVKEMQWNRTSSASAAGGERVSCIDGNERLTGRNSIRIANEDRPHSKWDVEYKLKSYLAKPIRHEDFWYAKQGIWQAIARHQWFGYFILSVILANALWIWIDTDLNPAELLLHSPLVFQLVENLFCTFFSLEWLIRFLAFEEKRNCVRELWFVFDTVLVVATVFETWALSFFIIIFKRSLAFSNPGILRLMRLMKLARMGRMARLVKAVPELAILIKGMMTSMRPVLITFSLLLLIMYVFAILFVQLTQGSPAHDRFSSVLVACYQLWLYGILTLDYAEEIASELLEVSWALFAAYYVFIFLGLFTVLNMLIGVLCELVSAVTASEKEGLMINYAREQLQIILKRSDCESEQKLSRADFMELIDNPEAYRVLSNLGVDVLDVLDLEGVIFESNADANADITLEDLIDFVIELRGSNHATVKDILRLRRLLKSMMTQLHWQNVSITALEAANGSRYCQNAMKTVAL